MLRIPLTPSLCILVRTPLETSNDPWVISHCDNSLCKRQVMNGTKDPDLGDRGRTMTLVKRRILARLPDRDAASETQHNAFQYELSHHTLHIVLHA